MAIADEIQRIKTNIANAYTQLESKGATIPTDKNSNNLASTINTVTTGGGGGDLNEDNVAINGSSSAPGIVKIFKKIDKSIIGAGPITSFSYAFSNMANLEEIDYTGIDISSVESFNYTFYNCNKLKKHDLSNRTFPKVTSLSNMHSNNKVLTEVNLTNTQFSKLSNIASMCYMCESLQILSEMDASSVNSIGGILGYCSALTSLGGFKDLGKGYPSFASANSSSYTLDLSKCNALTHDSLMNVINKLYDLNLTFNVAGGGSLKTQKLVLGSTNLAKLTSDEIAIATNKGWTVS